MIQTLTSIAITFQSTIPNASTSLITPIQIMTTTPISAATVLSTTLLMTTTIVIAKMAIASHAMPSTQSISSWRLVQHRQVPATVRGDNGFLRPETLFGSRPFPWSAPGAMFTRIGSAAAAAWPMPIGHASVPRQL